MLTYSSIFKDKSPFFVRHDTSATKYTFQLNDDKGEFIDQDGNVIAQLYDADLNKPYFVVAGMFMGEIIFKSIPYYRCVSQQGAHLIKTDKYIPLNNRTVQNESNK
jgi:hypothetical protein